jgi:hypothetical protein
MERAVVPEDSDASEWDFSVNGTDTRTARPDQTWQKETTELSMSNHYWKEVLSLFGDRVL